MENELTSLVLVPKKFLQDILDGQKKIIDLLGKGQDDSLSDDYIPESEAKKLLGRKTTWFWNLRKNGNLPFVKIGNRVWYLRNDIIGLFERKREDKG